MKMRNALKAGISIGMAAVITGCGTLTGIPSHGGGKRFAIEQELVSGTARAAAMGFDVSAIAGRRAAVFLTSIGDVGTGNLIGGRLALSAVLRGEAIHSPIVEEQSQFSVLDTYANTSNASRTVTGSNTRSSTSSRGSSSGTDNASTTAGESTSTTSADNSSSSSSKTSNVTSSGSRSNTVSTTVTRADVVTAQPTSTKTQTDDEGYSANIGIAYNGIGGYSSSQVVVARDTQFLSAIIQKYLVLKGVIVVPPELAEVDIYVTVDVFGTIRSREDWLVKNGESLKAKTAMEMAAIERSTGRILVEPQVSSYEAEYKEDFAFWMGPHNTSKSIKESDGLLADYTELVKVSN